MNDCAPFIKESSYSNWQVQMYNFIDSTAVRWEEARRAKSGDAGLRGQRRLCVKGTFGDDPKTSKNNQTCNT